MLIGRFYYQPTSYYEAEAIVTATAVGQQLMDEVSSKEFDENTINNFIREISGFTAADSLSPESGESYPFFDDVDDFNGFSRVDSTSRLGNFSSSVVVNYVDPVNPDVTQNTRTKMKKITINVTSSYLVGTLQLHYYSSY
jgi:hypothetical protein